MFPFKSLYAGQLVRADSPLALFMAVWCLMVDLTNVLNFNVKIWVLIFKRCQPIADLVGFEIGLFLKDVRRGGPKSAQQYPVS